VDGETLHSICCRNVRGTQGGREKNGREKRGIRQGEKSTSGQTSIVGEVVGRNGSSATWANTLRYRVREERKKKHLVKKTKLALGGGFTHPGERN